MVSLAARSLALLVSLLLVLTGCASDPEPARDSPIDRGVAHFEAGHMGLAAEQFRQALGRGQPSVRALNGLGAVYDRLGRFDLARHYYQRALALDPNSSQTLNNLGYSYLLQNRPDVEVVEV